MDSSTKLDGIASGANAYSHPTYTSKTSGLYKITVDSTGHVSAATAVAKADITGLGIPGSDTTYSAATQSAKGLMSAADKTKLDGIASGANAYSHPTGDGNLHVPATGTSNNGKVLTAGSTAGSLSWTTPLKIGTAATDAAAGNHNHDGVYLKSHQDISGKQDANTAVTHTASTAVGSATNPVYVAANGTATACTYSLNKSVPSDALFTDHTYNFSGSSFVSGNQNNGEHDANKMLNGHYYYSSNGPATTLGASTADGALYSQAYSDAWVAQIAQDYRNGRLFVRGKNSGTWQNWKRIANYDEIPTNTNQLTNGAGFTTLTIGTTATTAAAGNHTHSGYLTSHQDISGKVNKTGDVMSSTLKFGMAFSGSNGSFTDKFISFGIVNDPDKYGYFSANGEGCLKIASESKIYIASKSDASNGLEIGQSTLKYRGTNVSLEGHTHNYLSASSTLDATKLSGSIPSTCYANDNTTEFISVSPTLSGSALTLTVTGVGKARRTYADAGLVGVNNITFIFNDNNILNEHYLLFQAKAAINLGNITYNVASGVKLIKPIDLSNITVGANQYVELSFIPVTKTKVVMTVSEILG